jgi:DNA invertase Pin-like site-specific DNA recombinase
MGKKKIVCLSRVSSKLQMAKNSSPQDQEKQVREYCESIGAELVDTITCQVSGAKMRLQDGMLHKALRRAEELGADLAVSRLDRASRSAVAIIQLKEATETTGIDIHIASLNKSMKALSHLEVELMGIVASAELRNVQERVRRACKGRVGAFAKDVCPKKASKKGLIKRLTMTKDWADQIELKQEIIQAVKMLKTPNLRNVSQVLNGKKVLSRRGLPWTHGALNAQLKVLGWNWDQLKCS